MFKRISQQLMDAYMLGDKDEIDRLKAQINQPKATAVKVTNIVNVLNDDNSPSIKIYEALNKYLGHDWWEWEIDTIKRILWLKHAVVLDDINLDRVCAMRHLCSSDGAFSDWFEFNQLALSFGRAIADFETLRCPSPGMIIAAVKMLNYIRPDQEGVFGIDVCKYISIALIDQGVFVPPPSIVLLIKDEMKKLVSQEMVQQWVPILKRYNEFYDNSQLEVNETEIDIQARRLLTAEYAAASYCGD